GHVVLGADRGVRADRDVVRVQLGAAGVEYAQVRQERAGGAGDGKRQVEALAGGGREGEDVQVAGAVDRAGLGLPAGDGAAVAVGDRKSVVEGGGELQGVRRGGGVDGGRNERGVGAGAVVGYGLKAHDRRAQSGG